MEDFFADVIARASQAGDVEVPEEILSALDATADPLKLLSNWDKFNRLGKQLDDDCMFIRIWDTADKRPSMGEVERWCSLIRWLIQNLAGWTKAGDPTNRTLAAIFTVAAICDPKGRLWGLLPRNLFQNAELKDRAADIVKAIDVQVDAPKQTRDLISTREFIDDFAKAKADQDWQEIAESMHSFDDWVAPLPLQKQASRLLLQFGTDVLAEALSGVTDPVLAKMSLMGLSESEDYAVAAAGDNPFIQFAALRREVLSRDQGNAPAPPELAVLLQKLAQDEARWTGFMAEFNRYPVRYPRLQRSLGAALATASVKGLEAYVAPIILHGVEAKDASRTCVCECLDEFRAHATIEQRRLLWTLAHKRWAEWGFERESTNEAMLGISHSVLDYAIVGYALECLDDLGRQAEEKQLTDAISSISYRWMSCSTHMTGAIYRLLSKLQPFFQARLMDAGASWCFVGQMAPDLTQTDYFKIRYHLYRAIY